MQYRDLIELTRRPKPFSTSTIRDLWTDPHIARQMLGFHLDPGVDAASRRAETIAATVGWMAERYAVDGRRLVDLGCGPGLYAVELARRGATVTGLDFSPVSIDYAQNHMPTGQKVDYVLGDYLVDPLPGPADLITLIYGDYCALAPANRRRLLDQVRNALAPAGRFLFDVYAPGQMKALTEGTDFGHRYMNGFWSPEDYFGFRTTFLYPEEEVSLERYQIIGAGRTFRIDNWMQYFRPETISDELATAGFQALACLEVSTGAPWAGGATPFFVEAALK